jgi:hypothetical protein
MHDGKSSREIAYPGTLTELQEKIGRSLSMNIYYAHCMDIYDTPQELRDIKLLESLGFTVINPNQPEHQESCQDSSPVMDYFFQLTRRCDALAFRAIAGSSRIPAGVANEIEAAYQYGLPVIELPNTVVGRRMSVEVTRYYLKECGCR